MKDLTNEELIDLYNAIIGFINTLNTDLSKVNKNE
jgi:hypothetical protein